MDTRTFPSRFEGERGLWPARVRNAGDCSRCRRRRGISWRLVVRPRVRWVAYHRCSAGRLGQQAARHTRGQGHFIRIRLRSRSGLAPHALAVASLAMATDEFVQSEVRKVLHKDDIEVTYWGDSGSSQDERRGWVVQHRLSDLARAFKSQALKAAFTRLPGQAFGILPTGWCGRSRVC
jgi:hypothetical protein